MLCSPISLSSAAIVSAGRTAPFLSLIHIYAVELDEVKGDIEFRDVWFSYIPGEWVLQGVSFHVEQMCIRDRCPRPS